MKQRISLSVPEFDTVEVERELSWDKEHVAHSHSLVCPRCSRRWASLHFSEDKDIWPVGAYCETCAARDPWHPVPGSLLHEEGWGVIDTALLEALPNELLMREFTLHLQYYDRLQQQSA